MILRDRDTTGSGTLDERVYYLQNWRADVVALITGAGAQVEQVRYEPYSTPLGLPAGDINADGQVTQVDANQAGVWYLAPAYDVRADIDMDGDLDVTDLAAIAAARDNADTLARGGLSLHHNRKGYAGYEHLAELAGAKWDVRNRILISELGTWNRRDPLGYVDGFSLYQFASGSPIVRLDAFGLNSCTGTGSALVSCLVSLMDIAGMTQAEIIRRLVALGISWTLIATYFGLNEELIAQIAGAGERAYYEIHDGLTVVLRPQPQPTGPSVPDEIGPDCRPVDWPLPNPGIDLLPIPLPRPAPELPMPIPFAPPACPDISRAYPRTSRSNMIEHAKWR